MTYLVDFDIDYRTLGQALCSTIQEKERGVLISEQRGVFHEWSNEMYLFLTKNKELDLSKELLQFLVGRDATLEGHVRVTKMKTKRIIME